MKITYIGTDLMFIIFLTTGTNQPYTQSLSHQYLVLKLNWKELYAKLIKTKFATFLIIFANIIMVLIILFVFIIYIIFIYYFLCIISSCLSYYFILFLYIILYVLLFGDNLYFAITTQISYYTQAHCHHVLPSLSSSK